MAYRPPPADGYDYPVRPCFPAPEPVPMVWGVPLAPGERVLYYKRFTGSGERIFLFFMGIVFLVLLCGLWLLYLAIRYEQSHDRVYVITDRRLFTVSGDRKLRTQIAIPAITRIVRVTGAKQRINVHGASDFIIFRVLEHDHNLESVIQNLHQPGSLPLVAFEP